jgi:hypothetical protein
MGTASDLLMPFGDPHQRQRCRRTVTESNGEVGWS